jgi:putative FmdB family regulatory protein
MVLFSAEISCIWETTMPIFEYICDQCGNFFEELVRGTSSAMDIICPGCQSDQVRTGLPERSSQKTVFHLRVKSRWQHFVYSKFSTCASTIM